MDPSIWQKAEFLYSSSSHENQKEFTALVAAYKDTRTEQFNSSAHTMDASYYCFTVNLSVSVGQAGNGPFSLILVGKA